MASTLWMLLTISLLVQTTGNVFDTEFKRLIKYEFICLFIYVLLNKSNTINESCQIQDCIIAMDSNYCDVE